MAKKPVFEIIGFRELKDKLDPVKFERRFVRHVKRATEKNAMIGRSKVVQNIYSGKGLRKLSDLTITLKLKGQAPGGSVRLVGSGLLVSSIHGEAVSWHEAHIGVLKNRPRGNKDAFMIANVLHNGAKIPVTNKMRRLFAFWARKYGTNPLKASTKVIVLPKRPFLKVVLWKANIEIYKRNWDRAVQKSMSGKDR
jgi:hypothetical protein